MPSVMSTAAATGAGFSALLLAIRDVYSAEIYFSAQPNMRFDQFATRKDELGAQPGSKIIMPKFGNIKRGGKLTEGVRLQTRAMSMSTTSIEVDEQGNAIAMTERLLQTSFYDNLAAAAMLLGRDMAIVLDQQLRDTVRAAATKVYGGGKTSRNALTDGDVFTTNEIHLASETLETNNSPKWGNDFYVCFAHPHQISKLRQSPGWVNAQYYGAPGALFTGEVGRYNDVRFISTSMMSNGKVSTTDETGDFVDPGYDAALNKTATPALGITANAAIYQAIMFGEYSYGHAVGLPVELRDNGVQDFGREHALCWYSIWGQGLLETKNIVVIETA
jgi:N4-gp56 family major capsid protein